MSDDEIVARLNYQLERDDASKSVADRIGILVRQKPGAATMLIEAWQQWRTEHEQGPIPDWIEIPG